MILKLKVVNICKRFGDNIVIDNFSHEFTEGKVTAILGKSGCGKSTLLNIMMGLMIPDSGEVVFDGGKKLSAVFQEDRLCENLTVSANIRIAAGRECTKELVSKELSNVGLDGYENNTAATLSGGMKRRVALVRALLSYYDVLFLDEPFKGLDAETKDIVIEWCRKKTAGKTVIFVTHERLECERLADEIVELR